MSVETPRLRLLPYSPAHYLALIDGVEAYEAIFGWPAAEGLRSFIVSDAVSPVWLEQLRAAKSADVWAHGFAVLHRESGTVIGSAGFKGPPDADGMAEIAYGIVPKFEKQGFATEVAGALVEFALRDERVRVIRAHTMNRDNASGRVLEKNGFESIGEVVDPEDGPVWRWERKWA